ncbi:MAG: uroporphyrinogen decarboxylase family protein [Desulfobacterales bacterium]|nr:uroporphyrinogen decarboxylase family protein [Desulfobacterales bacterium]MDX2512469.1 uroporphyrinogen decarboxylase family protein [Desulfobacterales bacterium]
MQRSQVSGSMTSRERFLEVMRLGQADRAPYFEEGIRDEVIHVWREQGLSGRRELASGFPSDVRERMELDLYPRPELKQWPSTEKDLDFFREHLNPDDPKRFPGQWKKRVRNWQHREHVLMLSVHQGFFLSMGVEDWQRFYEVMTQLVDNPHLVKGMMMAQGEFAAKLTEKTLKEVTVDAVIFSEPIGGNDGPLMSPEMYENIVLKSYQPILDVLHQQHVETIVFQTFANARILIPSILKWGFNGLWACEVNVEAMDYRSIRKEFGKDLRLIGGIDLDALRSSKAAIKKEIQTKVPPLLDQGGYIPLADGRVREDVPFENYCYYREVLRRIIEKG